MSAEEATNKVQELYNGKIVSVTEETNAYRISLERETGMYDVMIDRESGDITQITRDEIEKPHSPTPDESAPNPEQSVKQLSEEEVIAIALGKVNGEIDEIELEQSGGLTYYLVEINVEDKEEATIQINSITGEVISITWDD
ncbi:peptidase M4 [Bacillus sp. BGMRC 2118]|nr:peptidase M4 [Bacillus sp. BGMRC 2118]